MRAMFVRMAMMAARFCRAPCIGSYRRDATSRNMKQRQHVDAAAVSSSTEPASATVRDAELQDHAGRGHDKHRRSPSSADDRLRFSTARIFLSRPAEITVLGVVGLAGPRIGLDALLDAVGAGHLRGHGLLLARAPAPLAEEPTMANDTGMHPQRRQRHAPVEEEQAERDEHRGDRCAPNSSGMKCEQALLQHRRSPP